MMAIELVYSCMHVCIMYLQSDMMDVDRCDIAELWVRAIRRVWTHDYMMKSLRKSGFIPFTRLRHLEGNKAMVSLGDCILRAEEVSRQEESYKSREVLVSTLVTYLNHNHTYDRSPSLNSPQIYSATTSH